MTSALIAPAFCQRAFGAVFVGGESNRFPRRSGGRRRAEPRESSTTRTRRIAPGRLSRTAILRRGNPRRGTSAAPISCSFICKVSCPGLITIRPPARCFGIARRRSRWCRTSTFCRGIQPAPSQMNRWPLSPACSSREGSGRHASSHLRGSWSVLGFADSNSNLSTCPWRPCGRRSSTIGAVAGGHSRVPDCTTRYLWLKLPDFRPAPDQRSDVEQQTGPARSRPGRARRFRPARPGSRRRARLVYAATMSRRRTNSRKLALVLDHDRALPAVSPPYVSRSPGGGVNRSPLRPLRSAAMPRQGAPAGNGVTSPFDDGLTCTAASCSAAGT